MGGGSGAAGRAHRRPPDRDALPAGGVRRGRGRAARGDPADADDERISIERVAINVDDARIADNTGARPVDRPVVARGPAAYFSTLPVKRLCRDLQHAGVPAEVSQTAGTYVCNHVFYALMHALRRRPGVRGGFVHIPYSPEQARRHPGAPALPVADVTAALRRMVAVAIRHADDVAIPGGATH